MSFADWLANSLMKRALYARKALKLSFEQHQDGLLDYIQEERDEHPDFHDVAHAYIINALDQRSIETEISHLEQALKPDPSELN